MIDELLNEWHSAVGDQKGRDLLCDSSASGALREALITEEYKEVIKAIANHDRENLAKELGDLVYVVGGTAHAYDIPLDEVLREVHRSNMTKLAEDGIKYRDDGKILKPASYEEADIATILARHDYIQRFRVHLNRANRRRLNVIVGQN